MTLPRLIHPVPVVIEQIDRASTLYDSDAREAVTQAARDAGITIPGQVKWGTQFGLEPTKTGPREDASGYVLFRRIDLDAASVTLQINDNIKKLGDVDADLYISRLEWIAHYPSAGGPTMVKAHFVDRQPAKQTRGVA